VGCSGGKSNCVFPLLVTVEGAVADTRRESVRYPQEENPIRREFLKKKSLGRRGEKRHPALREESRKEGEGKKRKIVSEECPAD